MERDPQAPRADVAPAAEALATLLQLLQAEGDALARGDIDALARVVRDKEASLRSLAAVLERADCAALADSLRQARDLNQRNARLLIPHANANRARLATLFGLPRSGALYSQDGRAAAQPAPAAPRGVRA